ncbi:MAG: aspartate/glutamate racemase family protein [Paracoccaceae bacterium]
MIAKGGKSIYGVDVGVLMLEARFPRIIGDMGNARTWPFPVRYAVVKGASPDLVVRRGAEGMLQPFIDAGRRLVEEGARLITTNCGFLSLFQAELSAALAVPVATSALMQAAPIQALLPPGRRVGALTISAKNLTPAHLAAAGCPADMPVWGVAEGCELQRVILNDEPELNVGAAEADMVAAATAFQAAHPELGAILFECTNMPPYKRAVAAATGLPVFSIETYLHWLVAALPGEA